ESRYGGSPVATGYKPELRELRGWIKREQRRVELRSELERSLPSRARLDFDDDGVLHITLPAEALSGLQGADGFALAGGELVGRGPGANEPAFALRRLQLPAELPGCELRDAVVALRFPDPGPTPRVAIVGCGGAALVVDVLHANAVAAALVAAAGLD